MFEGFKHFGLESLVTLVLPSVNLYPKPAPKTFLRCDLGLVNSKRPLDIRVLVGLSCHTAGFGFPAEAIVDSTQAWEFRVWAFWVMSKCRGRKKE